MINKDAQRRRFVWLAEKMLFIPYIWGGNDPSGFDCSGLVVECLQGVGVLKPKTDYTAESLWQEFVDSCEISHPGIGYLAFWFNEDGQAIHVAICLDQHFCITADGGGRHIRSVDDAMFHNAFVKVRPVDSRTTEPRFLNLFSEPVTDEL